MSSISKKNTNTITNIKNKRATLSSNLLTSNIITTPCEKVLSILRQVKNFIFNFSKEQTKLIQNLDWCIKVITSRSLYSYELKEKETINKLSEGNPEFKQLVDFVSEYNEKVIKMNRKYNSILGDKLLEKSKSAAAITLNAIKKEIEEIKKSPILDFLNSTHGKVLKNALEKKGMSVTILKSAKKDLFKERGERRKAEREEFGIKVNEFDDENIDKMKLDLYY